MVRIRLRRTGKTKQPSYRVVVADARSPRDGKFIEIIGHYNPVQQPKVLNIKADRARYWLSVGAQPSDTVAYLFKKVNIFDENGKLLPPEGDGEQGDEVVQTIVPEPDVQENAETTEQPAEEAEDVEELVSA